MEKDKGIYYQFPLSILQLVEKPKDMVQLISSYCMITLGRKFPEKTPEINGSLPRDYDDSNPDHKAILVGSEMFGITPGHLSWIVERYDRVQAHVDFFEDHAGRDMTVRIREDLIWQGLNDESLDMRHFCAIAGLYAAIGRSAFRPVPLEWWIYLARGWKSKKAYDALNVDPYEGMPLNRKKPRLLTISELKTTRQNLEARGLFVSHWNKRRRFFSIRLTVEELRVASKKKRKGKPEEPPDIETVDPDDLPF